MAERGNPVVSNESELYLTGAGPLFRWMQRFGGARKWQPTVRRRIIISLLITWFPMCLFAFLQGHALGPTPRGSFLLDFATYVRFFVGLPLLFIAEALIGQRLTRAGLKFVHDGLVREEDYPAFEQAIARLARRRESIWAALVLVALAVVGAWKFTAEAATGVNLAGWQSVIRPEGYGFRFSLAGLWNHLVALPVVLLLLYRWLWRILIWTFFLRDVARMNLELEPAHADRAGGLGFLGVAHQSFGILVFGVSSVICAGIAFQIVYEGASLEKFQVPLVGLLVVMEILFLGPLLMFSPVMVRARRAALMTYSTLEVRYKRDFQRKWIESPGPKNEPLLGSPDIQSMADLGNTFRFISEMRIAPFGNRTMIGLALATALPVLPLFLLVMPIREIINLLVKAAF
ncbi:conserved hypothetical protein [Pedosphaera parvula Ellin514]|uniref:Uncharacterized protein n=2 Tax=Pedosphaera TaxID=1032526 RepID=B9XIM3_PEDPL|nr:conserved hypothetical protein [Pedosphaera parvula Ellin514]